MSRVTCTVIVITRNRPTMVEQCLGLLAAQSHPPDQTIVVDASTNSETERIVTALKGIDYLYLPNGNHRMPDSRNLGIRNATGEVIAFLDDDSMAHPHWLRELLSCYQSPEVGGAGGRAIDANEPTLADPTQVGLLTPGGERIDNFNADPGRWLQVDRVRGCNMSFRRGVLFALGGFDANYTGSNVNEASDMGLRVRQAGYTILYNPAAVVDHLSAPREDIPRDRTAARTQYYLARNNTYLLLKNRRLSLPILRRLYWREPFQVLEKALRDRSWQALRWAGAHWLGKIVGTVVAFGPRRTDHSIRQVPSSR